MGLKRCQNTHAYVLKHFSGREDTCWCLKVIFKLASTFVASFNSLLSPPAPPSCQCQATHPNMRTYYFCTDTAKEMESWMKVMTDAALVHTEPIRRWVFTTWKTRLLFLQLGRDLNIVTSFWVTIYAVICVQWETSFGLTHLYVVKVLSNPDSDRIFLCHHVLKRQILTDQSLPVLPDGNCWILISAAQNYRILKKIIVHNQFAF